MNPYRTLASVTSSRVVLLVLAMLIAKPLLAQELAERFSDPQWLPSGSVQIDQRNERGKFDFVLSGAEKIRRDIVIDVQREVSGQRASLTWQLPVSASLQSLAASITSEFDLNLFACQGRDCGRSNVWANAVFENALLFGPDDKQRYVAGVATVDGQQVLLAAYLVQRGNLRKYLHMQIVQPDEPVEFDEARGVANALVGSGLAVLESPRPDDSGNFDSSAGATLATLAQRLLSLEGSQIYVVCHIYSSEAASEVLLASQRCADQAAALLRADLASGPRYLPFGAGPLLPRQGEVVNRLELVLPDRLPRDGRAGATFSRQ